jgi:hypothetical protein
LRAFYFKVIWAKAITEPISLLDQSQIMVLSLL